MQKNKKLLIAGVGGQGIVYLTNIIAEAALISEIDVSISEIHGLSQRGGIVTAGIGFGKNCTGFIKNAGVDFLIGLEPLETQRCLQYLHKKSCVVFGNYRIMPYSVNAQMAEYPDVLKFSEYLKKNCKKVYFIEKFPETIEAVNYNIYLLGIATLQPDFPLKAEKIEIAIKNLIEGKRKEKTLDIFRMSIDNFVEKSKSI
ncbi:MAG: 2-oxoacid:acceptor oxidoreductase family protein [Bacteroidetes bacterium]|nr:2-oxoacid:acceptor oxidoreductase family protein [Bacteroidota bacterium]